MPGNSRLINDIFSGIQSGTYFDIQTCIILENLILCWAQVPTCLVLSVQGCVYLSGCGVCRGLMVFVPSSLHSGLPWGSGLCA